MSEFSSLVSKPMFSYFLITLCLKTIFNALCVLLNCRTFIANSLDLPSISTSSRFLPNYNSGQFLSLPPGQDFQGHSMLVLLRHTKHWHCPLITFLPDCSLHLCPPRLKLQTPPPGRRVPPSHTLEQYILYDICFNSHLCHRKIESRLEKTFKITMSNQQPSTAKSSMQPCPLVPCPLNTSSKADSITSLCSPFQCLTTLSMKKFLLIFNLNAPWSSPCVLSDNHSSYKEYRFLHVNA